MEEILRFPDKNDMIQAAVDRFIILARQSIQNRGLFSVALSGGSTPQPLYQSLADPENSQELDWDHVHFFFGDERHVPLDHPDSNFRMVNESLFSRIVIPTENIHRVPAEMDARMAAFAYEEHLRDFFTGDWPRFDLVLLGMGKDGHTASLFPHTAGLNEEQRWFIANFVPKMDAWRLTLTKNAINNARQILVLVNGEEKAQMLAQVLVGHKGPQQKPIQLISPEQGEMVWMVDQEAASQLPEVR